RLLVSTVVSDDRSVLVLDAALLVAVMGVTTTQAAPSVWRSRAPGLLLAAVAVVVAAGVHALIPALPLLTVCVMLGIACGQVPSIRGRLDGILAPGIAFSARRLMRIGIVLLGLKLSL